VSFGKSKQDRYGVGVGGVGGGMKKLLAVQSLVPGGNIFCSRRHRELTVEEERGLNLRLLNQEKFFVVPLRETPRNGAPSGAKPKSRWERKTV